MLCEKSDLVIYAQVNRIEADTRVLTWFDEPRTVAVLDVIETFQGDEALAVRVEFRPNMVCPLPPTYPRGGKVLAFLRYDESRSAYFTTGLSYGAKLLDADQIEVYGKHLRTYFDLYRRASNHEAMSAKDYGIAINEWSIDLCMDAATLEEGAAELTSWDPELKQPGKEHEVAPPMLTREQLARISGLVYSGLSLEEWGTSRLARVLHAHRDPMISAHVIRYLRAKLALSDAVPFAGEYIEMLAQSFPPGVSRSAAAVLVKRYRGARELPAEAGESDQERELRIAKVRAPILREFLELPIKEQKTD